LPRLRGGSVVVADKTTKGSFLYVGVAAPDDVVLTVSNSYQDLLAFVRDPADGFLSMTIPFPEGFEVMIYMTTADRNASDTTNLAEQASRRPFGEQ
jgi:hypothetical protein